MVRVSDLEADPGQPAVTQTSTASSGQATVAFVLGVFSVVGLWLLGPVAIVVANGALRKVETGEIPAGSRGLAVVGRILGIIGTVFLALAILAVIAGVVLFVTRSSGP